MRRPAAKDIAFVLDTSGSMADRNKLEQAKKALNFCLANLNEDDRFDIVRFSTEAEPLFAELEQPMPRMSSKAQSIRRWTQAHRRDGDRRRAVRCARSYGQRRPKSARPFLIMFPDRRPADRRRDRRRQIVSKRHRSRASDVRIFCFGIGNDVNTHLLDRIADATRGVSQYVLPDEDIEVKVSSFYDKDQGAGADEREGRVQRRRTFTASQLYPAALPDLFKGETLLVFGRYSGNGPRR